MPNLNLFFFPLLLLGFSLPTHAAPLSLSEALKLSMEKNLDIHLSSATAAEKDSGPTKALGDFDLNFNLGYTLDDDRTPSSSKLDGVDSSAALLSRKRTYSLSLKKKFSLLGTEIQIPYSYPLTESNSTNQRIPQTHTPSLTLKATQPLTQLFSPGYFEKKLSEARFDAAIAASKHQDKISETLYKTAELYLDTYKEQETVKIKETALDHSKQTETFVREKHRVGRASTLDLMEAESSRQQNQEALISARSTFLNKKEELSLNVYGSPLEEIALDNPLKTLLPPPSLTFNAELVQTAIQRRPEAKSSRDAVSKAALTRKTASIDRYPKLSLKGDVTLSALNQDFSSSHQEITQRKFQSWSAEVALEHPLFMLASRGAYRIAELKLSQEEIRRLQTERNIALEIRKNLRQLQSNWERIQALQKVVEAETEKYEGEQARFQSGKISVYDFNLALKSRQNADLELLKARIDYQKTIYKLAESRGILLEELGTPSP